MKKICIMELLNAKQVKRMESIRSQGVTKLLRSVADAAASSSGIVNLSNLVAVLSNDITARAVFGGMCAQQGEYRRELGQIVKLIGGFCPADLFPSSRLVRWLSSGERPWAHPRELPWKHVSLLFRSSFPSHIKRETSMGPRWGVQQL